MDPSFGVAHTVLFSTNYLKEKSFLNVRSAFGSSHRERFCFAPLLQIKTGGNKAICFRLGAQPIRFPRATICEIPQLLLPQGAGPQIGPWRGPQMFLDPRTLFSSPK